MKIEFLYFEDCPSHEEALQRVQQVVQELEAAADITVTKVETEAEAEANQFTGSPTIRVNGTDLVPPPADAAYNLACRVYLLEDGRYSPLPSLRMIRQAVETAAATI